MLKFSKKAEYSIIALKHMLNQPEGTVTSAKEISTRYNIPKEILAKILQLLSRKGLVVSSKGVHGGYFLAKGGENITLTEILEIVEGPLGIVDCMSAGECDCIQMNNCTISEPLKIIQEQLRYFFSKISLEDINNKVEMQRVVWH
jgi:Rrf2 family protein